MESITRGQARRSGEIFYFTGNVCRNGHMAKRSVATGRCVECKAKNDAIYLADNREANRVRSSGYYHANRAARAIVDRAWRQANKEKKLAANRDWRAKNPESDRASKKKWDDAHPAEKLAQCHAMRARRRNSEGRFTQEEVLALLEKQNGLCVYCRVSIRGRFERDHIMPLARGGTNWIGNIQLLCLPCNRRKSGLHPEKFAQRVLAAAA